MPTVYTTQAGVSVSLGSRRLAGLLDRDHLADASEQAAIMAQAIEEASVYLDSRLGQRWVVPFAAYPATPDIVQIIARDLTKWILYRWVHPDGQDAADHFAKADATLGDLLAGKLEIPGAARVGASAGYVMMKHSGSEPVFSGRRKGGGRRSFGF